MTDDAAVNRYPNQRIVKREIDEEMRSSYMDYAMSVLVSRALPDVRDGLKPVHRRVLYAMSKLGLLHNKPFRKSATIVGNTMARYHPHGDSAIYDALVRMAQDFSLRYPLVERPGQLGLNRRRPCRCIQVHRSKIKTPFRRASRRHRQRHR